MGILFILICITYLIVLGLWLMGRIDHFRAAGGIRPAEEDPNV